MPARRSSAAGSGFRFSRTSFPSPASPEPLHPASPLQWSSNSITSSPSVVQAVPETAVHGLCVRDPSFSELTDERLRLSGGADGSAEAEPSMVAANLQETAHSSSSEEPLMAELLSFMGDSPPNPTSLDYSFALEYRGQPIRWDVPKVAPLEVSIIRPQEMAGTQLSTSLVVASPKESVSPRDKLHRLRTNVEVEVRRVLGKSVPSGATGQQFLTSRLGTAPLIQEPVPTTCPGSHGRSSAASIPSSVPSNHQEVAIPQALTLAKKKVDLSCLVPEVAILTKAQEKYRMASNSDPLENSSKVQERIRSVPGDLPDSLASTSSATSGALILSSAPSLSQKSSSPEIDEMLMCPSRLASPSIAASPSEPLTLPSEQQTYHPPSSTLAITSEPASLPGNANSKLMSSQMQHQKKGGCYSCLKYHRLQKKEMCMVCNTKYCSKCTLRAMGSMPEGRKCVGCIGQPIHESRRPYIGKCSRLLKKLLIPLEVQQIMKAEKECPVNQLRPEQLWVNGTKLSPEEMGILLRCSKPPLKLKPGRYWYDGQTGLWGKEGHRPDSFMSPLLKVGGRLKSDASNGSTRVWMNGRELGKRELRILKLSGVHCPPSTHLWVECDGSYSEEGFNNIKGKIWGKASIRFLYPFFSLPTPVSMLHGRSETANGFSKYPDYLEKDKLHKLLLLGLEGSGRSTIFKQANCLYKDGFTPEEKTNFKLLIQTNIYKYMSILLEGRERFEEDDLADIQAQSQPSASAALNIGDSIDLCALPPAGMSEEFREQKFTSLRAKSVYSMDTRLKQVGDRFLDNMRNGTLEPFSPAGIRAQEYAPIIRELWNDRAIKATYHNKEELHSLSAVAGYFLERVMEVSGNEFGPTEDDILRAEGLSQGSGLVQIEFCLEDKVPLSGSWQESECPSAIGRYQLIRVGGKDMRDSHKWLDMFEDVRAVVFCIALSDYDLTWADNRGILQNKMIQTRDLFESILKHPCFQDTPFVLLLNKYDVFFDKIFKGAPLTACEWFSDFSPVGASHYTAQNKAQQAYQYIVHKYKELFNSVSCTSHKLFTFQLNALDKTTVSNAFQYIREILKWEENRETDWGMLPEDLSYSTDISSFSHHSLARNNNASWDR